MVTLPSPSCPTNKLRQSHEEYTYYVDNDSKKTQSRIPRSQSMRYIIYHLYHKKKANSTLQYTREGNKHTADLTCSWRVHVTAHQTDA